MTLGFVYTVSNITWPKGDKLVSRWDCTAGQITIDDVCFNATVAPSALNNVFSKNQKIALIVVPSVTCELMNVTLVSKLIVDIYNTVGAKLMSVDANEGINTISLASLKSGIYIVKAEGKIGKVLKNETPMT